MARPTKAKALERLRRALDAIPELKQLRYDSPEFEKWQRSTKVSLTNAFGDNSRQAGDFDQIRFTPLERFSYDLGGFYYDLGDDEAYVRGFDSAATLLESLIEEVEEYWDDDDPAQIPSVVQANDRPGSNEVFVIHGRDEGTRETVARFLQTLGLEPVILQEKVNRGRTIIEKFEDHADAQFAVALLTPDDAGSLQGDKNDLKARARQNVIFELGFFIGRLGRKGVCALTKGDVEIPSDYAGVVYIPLDDFAGWKQKLFQELKSAGFQVDANRVF